jgi:hypothetical protein
MATITITPGNTFNPTETVTSTKLNNLGSPTAALTAASIGTADIADDAITPALIADNAITTPAILDANVTFAKLTDVIDDDTMATATDTTLATSESIKAYVDATRSKYVQLTGGTLALDSGNQIAGTSTYNIADFTSNDVDFTTSSITAIVIFGYAGSDVEVEAFVKATLPSGQETEIAYLHIFGSYDNKGRQGSSFSLPINKSQSSFNIRYSGGAACRSVILGAIIN